MKILMITSRLPWPLDKGDKLRAYHQIRHLNQEHDVFVFSLSEKQPSDECSKEIKAVSVDLKVHVLQPLRRWMRLALAVFSSRPFQVHWFYQRPAHAALDAWIEEIQPDVVLCQLVRMAEYVKDTHDVPRVLDYMDALSAGIARQTKLAKPLLRWVYRLEYQRLRSYESKIFDYFDGKAIISQADRALIAHPERNKIMVVPNGIDTSFFRRQQAEEHHASKFPTLLFSGNMSYPPNVDAAVQLVKQILPLIQTPHVRVLIAGTQPVSAVLRLASEQVEVTGWMPDIREAYAQSDVFVAPLRIGTGQQNKILEAMAMELPCVTTKHVLNGFLWEANDPVPLCLGDSPAQLAHEIDNLLSQTEKRRQIGRLSRNWVEKHCDWRRSTAVLSHTFVSSMNLQTDESSWITDKSAS